MVGLCWWLLVVVVAVVVVHGCDFVGGYGENFMLLLLMTLKLHFIQTQSYDGFIFFIFLISFILSICAILSLIYWRCYTAPCYIALRYVVFRIVYCCAASYCTVSCSLCSLYSFMPCNSLCIELLNCVPPRHDVLYWVAMYCVVLYCVMLCCVV